MAAACRAACCCGPFHAINDGGDVGLWIEAVQLCAFDQRVEDSGPVAAAIAADEHKILASDPEVSFGESAGTQLSHPKPAVEAPSVSQDGVGALNCPLRSDRLKIASIKCLL
jgi:hypothetical protein